MKFLDLKNRKISKMKGDDRMAHEKVYGICEDKCKEEVIPNTIVQTEVAAEKSYTAGVSFKATVKLSKAVDSTKNIIILQCMAKLDDGSTLYDIHGTNPNLTKNFTGSIHVLNIGNGQISMEIVPGSDNITSVSFVLTYMII